jgi:hypothetical protein
VLVGEIFCTALTKGNPFLNQEILQWLAICLPDGKGINKATAESGGAAGCQQCHRSDILH